MSWWLGTFGQLQERTDNKLGCRVGTLGLILDVTFWVFWVSKITIENESKTWLQGGDTWYPGFSWRVCYCPLCGSPVGWQWKKDEVTFWMSIFSRNSFEPAHKSLSNTGWRCKQCGSRLGGTQAWQDCRLEAPVPGTYGWVAGYDQRVLATTSGVALWKLYETPHK